ncbi:hypothetical protein DFH11DRAFT_1744954 [Phellopilus nigrolimitatus]|nr:hypothetical protein DFH11DRAFT_1744954 [Phellopilus nigrolimitatus]
MASSIENLKTMRAQLEGIYEYLPRFGLYTDRPPILELASEKDADESNQAASRTSSRASSGDLQNHNSDLLRHPHASIPGLRIFRENVKHDIEQIDKFLVRHASKGVSLSTSTFSTNAPYLIAVWNELIRAPGPITFVDKTFNEPRARSGTKLLSHASANTFSKKSSGVKVDVVADNGRGWIRVNTIKNSRLLAEFRELDSYLTDSEDEENDCSVDCSALHAPEELDNSLLQMGRALATASRLYPTLGSAEGTPPKVTLRLTRLLLDPESLAALQELGLKVIGPLHCSIASNASDTDPRIAQTLRELLSTGLEIELGQHDFKIPAELLSTQSVARYSIVPSRQINLDLSVLIALVSDLTHAPLPASADEAFTRFIPTLAERARSRRRRQRQKELLAFAKPKREIKTRTPGCAKMEMNKTIPSEEVDGCGNGAEDEDSDGDGASVHSRALANQAMREMDSGLLDEIAGRLNFPDTTSACTAEQDVSSSASPQSEFWTSREARDRCLRIVEKIGGPAEKRRASALFFREGNCSELTFGIGYSSADEAADAYWRDSRYPYNFVPGLVPVRIFDNEDDGDLNAPSGADADPDANSFWGELERACRRLLSGGVVAHPRAILVPGSTSSGAIDAKGDFDGDCAGADEIERAAVLLSNVRLTAHTVGTLFRGAARRWTTLTANRSSVREMIKESSKEVIRRPDTEGSCKVPQPDEKVEVAAIWIVEPRSLAEGMRGDFVAPSS